MQFLRNMVGDEDCLKPTLADMKLEPETENRIDIHSAVRKSDKVVVCVFAICNIFEMF